MKISIGIYVPGNSIIHRLDARIKFFANITFIVLFFLANTFVLQGLLLIPILIAFIIATKKPFKLIKIIKLPLWIGVFIFIISCFVLKTTNIKNELPPEGLNWSNWKEYDWVNWKGIFRINYGIMTITFNIIIRVYGIILTMTLLTLTTPPVLLIKALDFYFYPLKLIKVPTHIFIMIISIALRFIPTLVNESARILKAQASRGTDFKNGGFKTKIKATIVLIVPLFISAFSKAEDLANAMETRGYDPYAKRTSYRKWNYWWFDIIALITIIAILVISSIIISSSIIPLPEWWLITRNYI